MPVDPRIMALIDAPLRGRQPGKRGATVAAGYYGRPGSGPEGETCRSCAYRVSVHGGAKSFPKCALAKHKWARGGASDIRVGSPACQYWAAR